MTKQTWMTLALAAAIAVPAAAQQTSNDQNTQQPAASSSQTTQQQSTAQQSQSAQSQSNADLSARQPLQPDTHEGFWGKLNPFARKKYVQRQINPVRNRVNELDELTATNTKAITDVDQRAQEGIRLANAKATEADQHALDAGNRAQMAHQTAQQAATRLTTVEQVVTNIDQYKPTTQTEIRFRAGQTVLSQKAKAALDQMAEPLKNQRGYVIEVQGFSSGRGTAAIDNSQRMADAVVRYLVIEHEIPAFRIYKLGMGNVPRQASADGSKPRSTTGGRVEVSLLKNDVEQLSTQASAAPQANAAPATSTEGGVTGTTTATPSAQGQQEQQPAMSQPAAPAQPAQQPAQQTPPPQR